MTSSLHQAPREERKKLWKPFDINNNIEWSNIKTVTLSHQQTSSVFFVETQNSGEFVVIKNCKFDIANQVFGNQLALELELFAPQVKVLQDNTNSTSSPSDINTTTPLLEEKVTTDGKSNISKKKSLVMRFDKEGHDKSACLEGMKTWAIKAGDATIQVKSECELRYAKMLLLMEFIPNCVSLEDLSFLLLTKDPKQIEIINTLFTCEEILKDIGKILCLDICLNNWDRFVCGDIWENEGNPNNILFSKDKMRLAAVDQSLTSIIDLEKRKEYLDKIHNFATTLFNESADNNPYIRGVCQYIENYVGSAFTFSSVEFELIKRGMLEAVDKITNMSFSDLDDLFNEVFEESEIDFKATEFVNTTATSGSNLPSKRSVIDLKFVNQAIEQFKSAAIQITP
ncbi:hypothetical protein ABK040_009527 [Willaertia magna]